MQKAQKAANDALKASAHLNTLQAEVTEARVLAHMYTAESVGALKKVSRHLMEAEKEVDTKVSQVWNHLLSQITDRGLARLNSEKIALSRSSEEVTVSKMHTMLYWHWSLFTLLPVTARITEDLRELYLTILC